MAQIRVESRIPLIDIGTLELIRQGRIKIRPAIRSIGEREVTFEDDSREQFDAIITATGFRPGVARFLDPASDHSGQPSADRGGAKRSGDAAAKWPRSRVASANGLYFCGFAVSPIGMLREIGDEARRIAAHIARMH